MRKDRTPKVIAKQLHVLIDAADQWNLVAERLQPTQQAASDQFEHLIELCRQTSLAQGYAIQQFTSQLETHRESPPPWARPTERALTQSEFSERESRTYLWITVLAVATLILAIACGAFASGVGVFAAATVGMGLAVAAFAAGAFGSQNAPTSVAKHGALHLTRHLWESLAFVFSHRAISFVAP